LCIGAFAVHVAAADVSGCASLMSQCLLTPLADAVLSSQ
jgi:hypothetical protein